jgi:hypothetical protein
MLAIALAALARRFRKQLVVALTVGVLVGVVFYLGGRLQPPAADLTQQPVQQALLAARRSLPHVTEHDTPLSHWDFLLSDVRPPAAHVEHRVWRVAAGGGPGLMPRHLHSLTAPTR